ncbi:MAG: hypothetical protein HUJ92_03945 [Bacteroidales bacterium]|nr:hypothetical protein [Bacteroidales bacterium]
MAKFLKYILLGLSAILLVLFFVMPHSNTSDQIVNVYLYWTYVLVALAIVALVGFLLAKTFSSKQGIVKFVILLVGVVVLVGGAYVLAPGTPVATNAKDITDMTFKLTDTALILTYILFGGSIVALLGTTVFNAIKNR